MSSRAAACEPAEPWVSTCEVDAGALGGGLEGLGGHVGVRDAGRAGGDGDQAAATAAAAARGRGVAAAAGGGGRGGGAARPGAALAPTGATLTSVDDLLGRLARRGARR